MVLTRRYAPLSLLLPLALAACGEDEGVRPAMPSAPRLPNHFIVPAPQRRAPPPAHVLSIPGLEGVIGADVAELSRQFGPPRLDVWEGDAHKLQFSGIPCVLDIYLYPPAPGAEARATYVDARRSADARDVDRAACVAALRRH